MKHVKFSNTLRIAALTGGLFLSASAFAQQVVVKGHVKEDRKSVGRERVC